MFMQPSPWIVFWLQVHVWWRLATLMKAAGIPMTWRRRLRWLAYGVLICRCDADRPVSWYVLQPASLPDSPYVPGDPARVMPDPSWKQLIAKAMEGSPLVLTYDRKQPGRLVAQVRAADGGLAERLITV